MKSICIITRFFVKRIISSITLPALVVVTCVLSLSAQRLQHPAFTSYSSLSYITPADDFFYFVLNDDYCGLELWRSDGTAAGTSRVKDISAGPSSAAPEDLTMAGGVLYFTANDGVHGRELWRSDGTADGTVIVKDILPGQASSYPLRLGSTGSMVSFQLENETDDLQRWESDGTSGGTRPVVSASPETRSFYPDHFIALNGTIHLQKAKRIHERNGVLERRWSYAQAMLPMDKIEVNALLFFTAEQPQSGRELWRSDGTVNGTFMVKDIARGPSSSYGVSTPNNMAVLKGHLYFLAADRRHGTELWRSDGTSKGTKLVRDIVPGSRTSSIRALTSIDGSLYFSAHDGVHGSELWRSDGTTTGTALLKDIIPGVQSSEPRNFTAFHAHIYFSVFGADGIELWKTDGTTAGTVIVFPQNIHPDVAID